MTNKVQKIREEVERLRNFHQIKYQKLDTNDNMCLVECGKRNLCNELLSFIDSLQEDSEDDWKYSIAERLGVSKDEFDKMKPVSEDLENASFDYAETCKYEGGEKLLCIEHFKAGAKWHRQQMKTYGFEIININRKTLEYIYDVCKGVMPSKELFIKCVMMTIKEE